MEGGGGDIFGSLFGAVKRKWEEGGGAAVAKKAKQERKAALPLRAQRPAPAAPKASEPIAERARPSGAQRRAIVKLRAKEAVPPLGSSPVEPKDRTPEPRKQQAAAAKPRKESKQPAVVTKPLKAETLREKPPQEKPRKERPPSPEPVYSPPFDAGEPRQKQPRDRSREKERKQKRNERRRMEKDAGGPDSDDGVAPVPVRGELGQILGKKEQMLAAAANAAAAVSAAGGDPRPGKGASAKALKRSAEGASDGAGKSGARKAPEAILGASGKRAPPAAPVAKESRAAAEARVDADSGKAARARQQKMLSAIRSRGDTTWAADDEGEAGPSGQEEGQLQDAAGGKTAKKLKARQALLLKPEQITPAEKSGLSFEAEWRAAEHDHCETPFEAYQHIEPLLFKLAQILGKSKEDLRIYDPYFCEGSMVKHLGRLGFTNVYNRNEDFYKVVERGMVPEHDVLVTNPPYSADHMQRCLRFCAANGRPWLLLLPNFVYRKRDYLGILGEGAEPFYLCPPPSKRYVYFAPGRQAERTQATSPFDSFWYCNLEPAAPQAQLASWFENKYAKVSGCRLARTADDLPEDVVPVRLDKRPNPKARRRAQKRAVFIHKQFGVPMKHVRGGGVKDERG